MRRDTGAASQIPIDGADHHDGGSADLKSADDVNLLLRLGIDRTVEPTPLPIASLRIADRPRLRGEDAAHTLQLAAIDQELPPILVHRSSLRVIDGVHRVYAAMMRGLDTVNAHYFDGTLDDAFIVSVALNVEHGLALTLSDRRAAATRILQTHPQWSDRAVAKSAGLSATTISGLRRATANHGQLNIRLGRDGRTRPIDSTAGRQAAANYLAAHPNSSLRTVAKVAGISLGTAKKVRDQITHGLDPTVPCIEPTCPATDPANPINEDAAPPECLLDTKQLLESLARDPSLRMSDGGRTLLRWLFSHAVESADPIEILQALPKHSRPMFVDFAERCAHNWAVLSRRFRCE